jgi:hypothetical protein
MASAAIEKLARSAQSSRAALANIKEAARIQEERVYAVLEVGGGAAVAGIVDGYWGRPEIAGVPATVLTGAALCLIGLSGRVPGGFHLAAFGIGMVSGPIYARAEQKGAELAAA